MDLPAPQALPECKAYQESQESLARGGRRGKADCLELMDSLDHRVLKGRLAHQEILDKLDPLASLAKLDSLANPGNQANLVFLAKMVWMVSLATMAPRVLEDLLVLMALQGNLDQREMMDLQALVECQEREVKLAILVRWGLWDQEEKREPRENVVRTGPLDQRARKETRGPLDPKDRLDYLEMSQCHNQDCGVNLVRKEREANLEVQESRVRGDFLASKGSKVNLVLRVQKETKALQESKAEEEIPGHQDQRALKDFAVFLAT